MGSLSYGQSGMQAPSSMVSSDGSSALGGREENQGHPLELLGARSSSAYHFYLCSIGQPHHIARDDAEWNLVLCPGGKGTMVSIAYRFLCSDRSYSWVYNSSFAICWSHLWFKGKEVGNTPYHIWQSISLSLPFEKLEIDSSILLLNKNQVFTPK